MAKKRTGMRKRGSWNKGREVGQRNPFSPSEVKRIRKLISKRGDAGLRDLALFSTAIDTMLRTPDLLGLTVKDVRKHNRVMRDTVQLASASRGQSIQCTLSKATMRVLEKWIDQSAKRPRDYLFTGQKGGGLTKFSARQLSRLVKVWAEGVGLDASSYGIESLRRTRAVYILKRTGNLEAARILLGLADLRSTARYLRDPRPVDALAISRTHEI
ncbi:MAG: tyrosine-type recombinase/integrase [Anaerolineales bacterium]|nr:tyrosine-type recombinase/integrase [Pseudomonadales bacterium]MDP7645323.1 tyrosine-type recombinase/integrase [Anaerolineales bacterium]